MSAYSVTSSKGKHPENEQGGCFGLFEDKSSQWSRDYRRPTHPREAVSGSEAGQDGYHRHSDIEDDPNPGTSRSMSNSDKPPEKASIPVLKPLQKPSGSPKFHFCPADALILALGMIVLGLQVHVSLYFANPTKSIIVIVTVGLAVVGALAHNLITCRVIRLHNAIRRVSVRAACLSLSLSSMLVAILVSTLWPYSELKTGKTILLPGCRVASLSEAGEVTLAKTSLCGEIEAAQVLMYFLFAAEAIAAFLILTHWITVKDMRSDGLPLTLGELLRMSGKEVDDAVKVLRMKLTTSNLETKRYMVAYKLDLASECPV